jgi:hypothetical protein
MPEQTTAPAMPNAVTETMRPIYVRKVPQSVWDRVHHNAIASRMRLSEYLVRLMDESGPFTPMTCGRSPTPSEGPAPDTRPETRTP